MSITLIVVLAFLLAILAIAYVARDGLARHGTPAPATSGRKPDPAIAPAMSSRRPKSLANLPAPQLQMIEWTDAPPPLAFDAVQARVRDRYIAARFPGVMAGAADLADLPRVLEAARLYFDERKFDRAHELLQLAIEIAPREAQLRLAQLEIAFLKRDAPRFVEAALALRTSHPECAEWKEVERLGRALAPDEKLFGATPAPAHRGHQHYGPWPDMPNWMGASWDLTAEVRAADFHQAMSRAVGHEVAAHLRSAA